MASESQGLCTPPKWGLSPLKSFLYPIQSVNCFPSPTLKPEKIGPCKVKDYTNVTTWANHYGQPIRSSILFFWDFGRKLYPVEMYSSKGPNSFSHYLKAILHPNFNVHAISHLQVDLLFEHAQPSIVYQDIQCALFSFPPSPPMNLKDGQYKVRDYLTLTTWANHGS